MVIFYESIEEQEECVLNAGNVHGRRTMAQ